MKRGLTPLDSLRTATTLYVHIHNRLTERFRRLTTCTYKQNIQSTASHALQPHTTTFAADDEVFRREFTSSPTANDSPNQLSPASDLFELMYALQRMPLWSPVSCPTVARRVLLLPRCRVRGFLSDRLRYCDSSVLQYESAQRHRQQRTVQVFVPLLPARQPRRAARIVMPHLPRRAPANSAQKNNGQKGQQSSRMPRHGLCREKPIANLQAIPRLCLSSVRPG